MFIILKYFLALKCHVVLYLTEECFQLGDMWYIAYSFVYWYVLTAS